jgi:hypothetical protein
VHKSADKSSLQSCLGGKIAESPYPLRPAGVERRTADCLVERTFASVNTAFRTKRRNVKKIYSGKLGKGDTSRGNGMRRSDISCG